MADALTDRELRRQLAELGSKNIGPITATTRSIYIKKLNHLKSAAKKASAATVKVRPGRKLVGFSSDESEGDSAPEPVGRRGTVSKVPLQSSFFKQSGSNKDINNSISFLTRPSLRTHSHANSSNNHVPTSSFSMQASFNSTGDTESGFGSRRPTALGGPSPVRSDPNGFESSDSEDLDHDDQNNSQDYSDLGFSSPEKVSVSVNTSPRLDDSSLFNRTFSKIGNMWGSGGRGRLHNSGRTNNYQSFPNSITKSTTRKYCGESPSNSYSGTPNTSLLNNTTNPQNIFADEYTVGHTILTTPSRHRQPSVLDNTPNHISQSDKLNDEETILKEGFKTKEDPSSYSLSQKIPLVLEGLFIIFFAALALALVVMSLHPQHSRDLQSGSKDEWMISPDGISKGEYYERESVQKAREVVLDIAELVAIRAGDYDCGWHKRRNMTRQEIRIPIERKYGKSVLDATNPLSIFNIAMHLIHKNPHWRISLYDAFGNVAKHFKEMQWMESNAPHHGFLCHAQYIGIIVCYAFGGISLVAALVTFCWWRAKRRDEETQAVYKLEEQIIDILKKHHDKCQTSDNMQPFLAIPHVRDMLIPPKDRRRLQSRWDTAVKFLSANESRVRVETQKIAGEEFAVWRWLQTTDNGKVWQGPAFGENRDSLKHFKFQCLKIRNMFDPDIESELDWHINIEDAILEKVSSGDGKESGIVHLAVDKTSREGCVYVKCMSSEEAGKAYRALHGWWFDNNLVTVKYLRTERYYERYPEAAHAERPLTPSNNYRRSLSQPFHQSIYESC